MFFIMGINQGRKMLNFNQMIICDQCGSYGRYQVFMTYTVLSLFFIPCLKWGKRYYVQTTCCDSIYELNAEVGKRIARGEEVEILPEDLYQVQQGIRTKQKTCSYCGYTTQEDFGFCPKCGAKFEED